MTPIIPTWNPLPPDLTLPSNQVHIWRAHLDQPPALVEQLFQLLSPDEQARPDRFRFAHDRRRYIVSHAILRSILTRYTHIAPGSLQFITGPHGKPALASIHGIDVPHFNLSHSHEFALYAISHHHEVGIDVEYLRPVPEAQGIADRYFSSQEKETLRSLPPDQLDIQFLTYWTRMESSLKARGEGLPGLPERPIIDENIQASTWLIHTFTPVPGYIASFAVNYPLHVIYYEWSFGS